NEVWIADETFYIFPSHSEKVIDLLARYGFHWWVMTRLELCLKHLDGWVSRGMAIVAFGLESIHDEILAKIGKKINLDIIREFRKLTLEKNIFTMPSYMIGYEEDTVESVLQDYEILDKIGFDAYQLSILTPLPKLPMTERIESLYGIFDRDYHHYTAVDLVWHHPHITPARMKFLHRLGLATLNASANYLKGTVRIIQRRVREKGFGLLWDDVARPFLHSLSYNERKQVVLPNNQSD
ncbi:MAG: hypothetical protein U9Q76_07930, partial [candidate division WOR-3 bacterium]|nr:hypothetical protein [candidate division WOR-3 bacterium]